MVSLGLHLIIQPLCTEEFVFQLLLIYLDMKILPGTDLYPIINQ